MVVALGEKSLPVYVDFPIAALLDYAHDLSFEHLDPCFILLEPSLLEDAKSHWLSPPSKWCSYNTNIKFDCYIILLMLLFKIHRSA